MSQKSNYLEDALINHVLRNTSLTSPTTVYVGLSTADPTEDGSGITEPTEAWYDRQSVTFGAPTDGSSSNSAEVDYTDSGNDPVDAGDDGKVVSHFFVSDAQTAGNMLYYAALDSSKTLNTGDEVKFASGQLTISEA